MVLPKSRTESESGLNSSPIAWTRKKMTFSGTARALGTPEGHATTTSCSHERRGSSTPWILGHEEHARWRSKVTLMLAVGVYGFMSSGLGMSPMRLVTKMKTKMVRIR